MRWPLWSTAAIIAGLFLLLILVPELTLFALHAFEGFSGILLVIGLITLLVVGWTFFPTTVVFAVLALPLLAFSSRSGLVYNWLAIMLLLAGLGAMVRDLEVTTFRWVRTQGLPQRRQRRVVARLAGETPDEDRPLQQLL